MLEIKNLSIKLNDRYLVENLSLVLNKNDKLAIIGEEGNGKSTLLKAILGIANYVNITGTINVLGNKIGYLAQNINEADLYKRVFDYLFLNDNDYYNKVNSFYKYLEIINLEDTILEQLIKTLSGGEKVKIGILKLLLEENDILFLDEPTNDLDLDTLSWLENFLVNTSKPIMYVSHDEVLLSKTANIILHLEQINNKTKARNTLVKTDYDTYISERLKWLDKETQLAKSQKREYLKKEAKLQQVMNKVHYEQNTISRSAPHGAKLLKKKMHSLKAQEKKLDNMELTEIPDTEESINFFFEDVFIPSTKKIISLNISELKFSNKVLAKNILLDVIGNTHLCIVGNNGVGKTTLMKIIYEELKVRKDIKLGYMPQNYDDILNDYENVMDFLNLSSKDDITKARMYLGNMKFTREEMTGKIKNLSNGAKAKLFLLKLVLDRSDVLLLDEPTRNVSPLSNPVIRKVLNDFKGTIISITHDRKYISEVANKVYILTKDGLREIN